jgi:hypothetical protein
MTDEEIIEEMAKVGYENLYDWHYNWPPEDRGQKKRWLRAMRAIYEKVIL